MTGPASSPPGAPTKDRDEFFIGWLPVPRPYVWFLRPLVAALVLTTAGMAIVLALLQRHPGTGRWDVDDFRTFDGIVYASPYALVRVPGEKRGDPPRTLLLVEEGKVGARSRVERLVQGRAEGVAVRVSGTILHRHGRAMLELAQGDQAMRLLTPDEAARLPSLGWPVPQVLAEHTTLRGEVIDSKCYLGAMRPGGGKTHKACATLCVSGGVPPMLVSRDERGHETFYLLATSEAGPANELVRDFVGDAVAASGRLERRGDVLILRLAPGGLRRR